MLRGEETTTYMKIHRVEATIFWAHTRDEIINVMLPSLVHEKCFPDLISDLDEKRGVIMARARE